MRDKSNLVVEELDQEWIKLLYEAKGIGLSTQEIREFLEKDKTC
ncbi:anti-repressor SinI family protein [Priestia megaterium]|nr:anti-repressor SinI family protein [Priestia megaterium]MBV6737697.1 anti-repressor SinI family protein [Priestia megaterium]